MMFIRKFSHLTKLVKFNATESVFPVVGYPRSGTSFASMLISLLTANYYDRNNIFPASGDLVWHTHWLIKNKHAKPLLYISRNPVDVAVSAYFYQRELFSRSDFDVLNSKKICKHSWKDHFQYGTKNYVASVKYEEVLMKKDSVIQLISTVTNSNEELVCDSIDLLNKKYKVLKGKSDLVKATDREEYNEVKGMMQEKYLDLEDMYQNG